MWKKLLLKKKTKKTWLTMSSCNGHFFTRQTIRHLVTWGCKCPSVHNIFCPRSQFKGLASGFSWDFQRITAFLKRQEHTKKTRFRPGAALQASRAHQISQFKLETLSRYPPLLYLKKHTGTTAPAIPEPISCWTVAAQVAAQLKTPREQFGACEEVPRAPGPMVESRR